jgi:hypothetical protein
MLFALAATYAKFCKVGLIMVNCPKHVVKIKIKLKTCMLCWTETSNHLFYFNSVLSVSDFWWTMWYWEKFVTNYFGFPLSVSFHPSLILIYLSNTDAIHV